MKSYSLKEVIKVLKSNGWKIDRITGGHYIFTKQGKQNLVTVSISRKIIPIGTLKNIEKNSGIKFK